MKRIHILLAALVMPLMLTAQPGRIGQPQMRQPQMAPQMAPQMQVCKEKRALGIKVSEFLLPFTPFCQQHSSHAAPVTEVMCLICSSGELAVNI